jgi:SAM-dependent methyltransferase
MTTACLRTTDGSALPSRAHRWLGPLTVEDATVLARAVSPVLDVGCGPGRHVVALAERGKVVLGIDITPAALALARSRGASVLARSVFERIPGAGRWASALLLDGNAGIGGEPATLLARVASLLRPRGTLLVELEPPGQRSDMKVVSFDIDGVQGPWFAWTAVRPFDLPAHAAAAAQKSSFAVCLSIEDVWRAGNRWFGSLRRG